MCEHINEFEYEYHRRIDSSMCTLGGAISPGGLQRLCVCTVEEHLENINLSIDRLMREFDLSWILLSLTVKILSPIRLGDELVIRTRHTNRRSVIYRRELEIRRGDEIIALAASFSSIIDIKSRRICTDRALLDSIIIPHETPSMFEADHRHRVQSVQFEPCYDSAVRPCLIDPLGHVNNLRYADFVHDAIPEDLLSQLGNICEFAIYFTGELKSGDDFGVMTKREGNSFEVLGTRRSDSKPAFSARLVFNQGDNI